MTGRVDDNVIATGRGPSGQTSEGPASLAAERPTMRDVAERAGVSVKTVSRVVNGEPGVGDVTAAKVARAVNILGFRRNDVARSLRHGRSTATVGLVIGDVANPFYSAIARGIEEVAKAHGHLLITASSDEDHQRERELVGSLFARRIDGLLLVPAIGDQSYLAHEQQLGTPIVTLDRPARNLDADAVVLDNVGGARGAVEQLLRCGHERVGIVGDAPTLHTAGERFAGYQSALESVGLDVDPALVRLGPHTSSEAEKATLELLASPDAPTAVFATNNRMTVGVLRALWATSSRLPVAGFDDFELSDMIPVPVAVVVHDPTAMGRTAAKLLFARIAGDRSPPQQIVGSTRLVLHGTWGAVP